MNDVNMYSIKMRASKINNNTKIHISGAEKIVKLNELEAACTQLIRRAMLHERGEPNFVSLKINSLDPKQIMYIDALPVSSFNASSPDKGIDFIMSVLKDLNVKNSQKVIDMFKYTYDMRGAMLLDADTMQRLEYNHLRGIRATCMDYDKSMENINDLNKKNHFKEALVLATKVVKHPCIIADICISDDPMYVNGYIASKKYGYIRICGIKKAGDPKGGRIFLFRGNHNDIKECIEYLEKKAVIVKKETNI